MRKGAFPSLFFLFCQLVVALWAPTGQDFLASACSASPCPTVLNSQPIFAYYPLWHPLGPREGHTKHAWPKNAHTANWMEAGLRRKNIAATNQQLSSAAPLARSEPVFQTEGDGFGTVRQHALIHFHLTHVSPEFSDDLLQFICCNSNPPSVCVQLCNWQTKSVMSFPKCFGPDLYPRRRKPTKSPRPKWKFTNPNTFSSWNALTWFKPYRFKSKPSSCKTMFNATQGQSWKKMVAFWKICCIFCQYCQFLSTSVFPCYADGFKFHLAHKRHLLYAHKCTTHGVKLCAETSRFENSHKVVIGPHSLLWTRSGSGAKHMCFFTTLRFKTATGLPMSPKSSWLTWRKRALWSFSALCP